MTGLKEQLRDPVDDEAVERIAQRIDETLSKPERANPRNLRMPTVAAIVAAAGVGLAWLGASYAAPPPGGVAAPAPHGSPVGPVRLRGGRQFDGVFDAHGALREVPLEDGSYLELEPGARFEVVHNGSRAVDVAAVSGRVAYDIRPGGPRRWTVDAGIAQVVVVGTRFIVERAPDRVRVSVERGHVRVESSHLPAARDLFEGDTLVVEAGVEPAVTPSVTDVPPSLPPDRGAHASSWRGLLADGRPDAAFDALAGRFEAEVVRADDVETLMALADAARLSDHPRETVRPLEIVITEHPDDPRAALAAFTLGRLWVEALGDPVAAARAFEQTLALRPSPAIEEAALARLTEVLADAGQYDAARDASQRLARRYPESLYLARVESRLEAARSR